MQPQKTQIGSYEVVVTPEYLTYRLGSSAALLQSIFFSVLATTGIVLLWLVDWVSKDWRPWATLFLVLVIVLLLKDIYSQRLPKVFDLRTGYFGARGKARFALREIESIYLRYDDGYENNRWRVLLMPHGGSNPLLDVGFTDEDIAGVFASIVSQFLKKPLGGSEDRNLLTS